MRRLTVSFHLFWLIVFGAIIILAALILSANFARSGDCIARPGRSHGAIWWRYRVIDGRHCWYPGSRYGHNVHYHVRAARLNEGDARRAAQSLKRGRGVDEARTLPLPPDTTTVVSRTRETSGPTLDVTLVRPVVRSIPMSGGRYSPIERIERGFDGLVLFPIEDDDQ